MPDRVQKTRSRKTIERENAAAFIALNGSCSEMPCTYCFKNKKACKFVVGRKDCGECVRRGRPCDGVFVGNSLSRLIEQQRKLDQEAIEAEDDLIELQAKLSAAVSRLARIRRIRNGVKAKSEELFNRGMDELEQESETLAALDAHEILVVNDLQNLGVPNEVDWSQFGLGGDFGDVNQLVTSPGGPSGDTAVGGGGSSSSA